MRAMRGDDITLAKPVANNAFYNGLRTVAPFNITGFCLVAGALVVLLLCKDSLMWEFIGKLRAALRRGNSHSD